MKASHCLLTHFSARYPKLPPMSEEAGGDEMQVAMAFDLMTLRLDEFWKMDRFRPAMDLLFGDDEEDGSEAGEAENDKVAEGGSPRKDNKGKQNQTSV